MSEARLLERHSGKNEMTVDMLGAFHKAHPKEEGAFGYQFRPRFSACLAVDPPSRAQLVTRVRAWLAKNSTGLWWLDENKETRGYVPDTTVFLLRASDWEPFRKEFGRIFRHNYPSSFNNIGGTEKIDKATYKKILRNAYEEIHELAVLMDVLSPLTAKQSFSLWEKEQVGADHTIGQFEWKTDENGKTRLHVTVEDGQIADKLKQDWGHVWERIENTNIFVTNAYPRPKRRKIPRDFMLYFLGKQSNYESHRTEEAQRRPVANSRVRQSAVREFA